MLGRNVQGLLLSLAVSTSIAAVTNPAMAVDPSHLIWAEDVAPHVLPENNDYGSGTLTTVRWGTPTDLASYKNYSVCNSFVTKVLQKAYYWTDADFRTWMGASSPLASTYHDTIQAGTGFSNLTTVGNIQVGDLIAVKYPAGSTVSGHLMIVSALPRARTASNPLQTGTSQWEVEIIDSSSSNHGTFDTRVMADGTIDAGVGIGTMRLYTNANGTFAGHTWSISSGSTYYSMTARHLVVGRVTRAANPPPAVAKNGGNGGGYDDDNGNHNGQEKKLGGYDYTLEPME